MTSDEIRAGGSGDAVPNHSAPDAVRFTFMQVMAMIEREGYANPARR